MRRSLRASLAVVVILELSSGPGWAVAGSLAIGTILTNGAFRLNNATLINNATLFEGATIESGAAVSRVNFSSGTRLVVGAESKGRVFGDHLVLERGQSRIDKANGFRVEARGLKILPDTGASTGRVLLAGIARVEVVALTGSFRVLNSRGLTVANIPAGTALALEPQSTMGPSHLTGRLMNRGGHYLLKDETTHVTVEVSGLGLVGNAGRRLEVMGATDSAATPVSDATQVIRVARVMQAPAGTVAGGAGGGTAPAGSGGTSGGSGGAAGGTAGGAGGAASGAAISVTMIAIIGGVAAAAVVGGLAATGSIGSGATAPVSR